MKRLIFVAAMVLLSLNFAQAQQPTKSELLNKADAYYENKQFSDAFLLYKQAAEQGNDTAYCKLGICYQFGNGVKQDYIQAVYWYKKSAEQGYGHAQQNLGMCYYKGWGVIKDNNQAIYWLKKAAEQGLPMAKYYLEQVEEK